MKHTKNIRKTGILITLAGGCLWGLSGACGQFLFAEKNACSDWLVPIRLVLAGFLLTAWYLLRRPTLARQIWSGRKSAITLLCYGILGMMLCQYSYFKAIEYSNAGTATVLQYLSPVLIMIVMCIRKRRLPGIIDTAAVLLLCPASTFWQPTDSPANWQCPARLCSGACFPLSLWYFTI